MADIDVVLRELSRVRRDIEAEKSKRDKKQGELDGIMRDLSQRFRVKTLAEAKKKLATLDADLDRRSAGLRKKLEVLKEKYGLDV